MHADNDKVILRYASNKNITFHGFHDSGVTWGEWRDMDNKEKDGVIADAVFELVDVTVDEDE